MKKMTAAQIADAGDALEVAMPGTVWFTPVTLAKRWGVAPSTVRAIPIEQLRYKDFGNGVKQKMRRYRPDWVAAYENETGTQPVERAA